MLASQENIAHGAFHVKPFIWRVIAILVEQIRRHLPLRFGIEDDDIGIASGKEDPFFG